MGPEIPPILTPASKLAGDPDRKGAMDRAPGISSIRYELWAVSNEQKIALMR
jgi:hypothetical protein